MAQAQSATIGLKNLYVFKCTDGDAKTGTTYAEGVKLAPVQKATLNARTAEAVLYGDDRSVDTYTNLQGYDLTFDITGISNEDMALLFGHAYDSKKGILNISSDDVAPYFGVAFETPLANGEIRFEFLTKVKFAPFNAEYETKGENLAFKTPSITAKSVSRESDGLARQVGDDKNKADWYKASTHNVSGVSLPA